MIDNDLFVIDAIAHCFGFSDENCVKGIGEPVQDLIYDLHSKWNPPELVLPREMILWHSLRLYKA